MNAVNTPRLIALKSMAPSSTLLAPYNRVIVAAAPLDLIGAKSA